MGDSGRAAVRRQVDFELFDGTPVGERLSQKLIDPESDVDAACTFSYIRTPPGGGSPAGMHTHAVDQHFFILEGTMSIEVDGDRFDAEPGCLVVFPAGVPHKNWNEGVEPTVHLAINAPLPPPGVQMTIRLG